jgi:peptide/nickel transport system ATP-binding protein
LERTKHTHQITSVNTADQQLCAFLGRCSVRIEGKCNKQPPPWVTLAQGNQISCHLEGEELQQLSMQVMTPEFSNKSAEDKYE